MSAVSHAAGAEPHAGPSTAHGGPPPSVSVVIATYDRSAAVSALLGQLAGQTLPAGDYEVLVVDDGSRVPVAPTLATLAPPYELTVMRQPNAGPAAARDTAIRRARGALIVVLDDDMSIGADFLAAHLAAHDAPRARVVLGRMRSRPSDGAGARGFLDGWRMRTFDERIERLRAEAGSLHGEDVYTGNVSFPRREYLAVGGFDRALRLSEDAELGLRLERAGAEVVLADAACSWHVAEPEGVEAWARRAVAYGAAEARIGRKHPDAPGASPWRYVPRVQRGLRPFLFGALAAPAAARVLAWAAVRAALVLDRAGARRAAAAATTLSYGMLYMCGASAECGGGRRALAELRSYLAAREAGG